MKTELAGAVGLGIRSTHDSDVAHILRNGDLEIISEFFRFNPHSRL